MVAIFCGKYGAIGAERDVFFYIVLRCKAGGRCKDDDRLALFFYLFFMCTIFAGILANLLVLVAMKISLSKCCKLVLGVCGKLNLR